MSTEIVRELKDIDGRDPLRTPGSPAPAAPEQASSGARARAYRPRRLEAARHAVFLVPGLLGFESVSTFSYFADRVVSALRSALEVKLGQAVYVVAVPIPPTASLSDRQAQLVRTIAGRLHTLEHGQRPLEVHLVGHSTGGVDANLLTNEDPLPRTTKHGDSTPASWASLDPRAPELRRRIRSVISIASPHQGACIASDPVGQVFGARKLSGLPALAGLLGKFAACSLGDIEVEEFGAALIAERGKGLGFALDVLRRWPLLKDLDVDAPRRDTALAPEVVRRSFVTVAGRPRAGSGANSDAFFRALSERASGWATGAAERGSRVRPSLVRLNELAQSEAASDWIIRSPLTEIPQLDAGHNDGVVNSARQLIDPLDPDELVALVAADHFDVVGYYDRYRWVAEPGEDDRLVSLRAGLMHSGSVFRDDEFFALWDRVAGVIAAVASSLGKDS
jgi:hypothetical protein